MKPYIFLDDSKIERIQNIVQRLEHSVSELKVRNWLEQFEADEWDVALDVLMKFEYFSANQNSMLLLDFLLGFLD